MRCRAQFDFDTTQRKKEISRHFCAVATKMDSKMLLLMILILAFKSEAFLQDNDNKRHPVILIPGDGGSQMQARLNKTQVVHYLCAKKSDWYALWLNLEQMVPEVIDCWADNMKLQYDAKTHTTHDSDGVETRVPGFGNSSTVEYLDESLRSFSIYFAKVATHLLTLGYQRGVDLHGAPYDFRKAANEHAKFFDDLKSLVEKTYAANGNRAVVFICHSMGSPMALYFLNHQTQAWKDKYIKAMVTMAGVWGGTVRAVKVFAIGDNLGTWIISSSGLMTTQRTNPSLAWLMPSDRLWKKDEILVQSDNINITVANFAEFYKGMKLPTGAMMWNDVKGLVHELTPPGVDVFCLHGSEVPTTERLVYKSFPKSKPTLLKGDGDGTVNIRSLLACTEWENKQPGKQFQHRVFPKLDHLELLRDDSVAEYVKNIVGSLNDEIKDVPKTEDNNAFYPIIDIVH